MPKFFAVKENINGDTVTLGAREAAHIHGSLRCKPGDRIVICDGGGTDYNCRILQISTNGVVASIIDECPSDTESQIKVTLFQSVLKGEKMDYVIQKCVELGVYEIVPVITERTIIVPGDKGAKKIERYNKISESAAKQCMRGIVPRVRDFVTLGEAVRMAAELSQSFVAYENESLLTIKEYLRKGIKSETGMFIGPEGGFSPDEVKFLSGNGVSSVSLGKRILRAETAGLAALTMIMYEGEF